MQKCSKIKKKMLTQQANLNWGNKFDKQIGFSFLWKKLKEIFTKTKKPVIGHNMFYDLLFMVHNFEKNLTVNDYYEFKQILHKEIFPMIYDTKLLAQER